MFEEVTIGLPAVKPSQRASLVAAYSARLRLASFACSPSTRLNPGPTPDLHVSFLPAPSSTKSELHWLVRSYNRFEL